MGQRYILQTGGNPCYAMRGKTITVVTYADGRIELLDGNKTLNFRVFDTKKHGASAVDDKGTSLLCTGTFVLCVDTRL